MILQALCEYYQRKESDNQERLSPFGFEEKEIPFRWTAQPGPDNPE